MRWALATCLTLGLVSSAFAQGPQGVQETGADQLFQRGVDALRAGHHPQAAEHFQASFRLQPQAKTACNLGLTYEGWPGHAREARDAYVRCAELDDSDRFRDHALERAAALREAAALQVQVDPDPPIEPAVGATSPTPRPTPVPVVVAEPIPEAPPPLPRTHGMLWAGIPVTLLGGGLLIGGGAVALGSQNDSDALLEMYPLRVIAPGDTDSEQRYEDLKRKARLARVLYISGGIVAAGGLTLVLVDLLTGGASPDVALAPIEGGFLAQGSVDF